MKLALGTVQFGKNYGLVRGKKISKNNLKKIKKLIIKSNIKFIDTSVNYGSSEKVIGSLGLGRLNIITKIKLPKKKNNLDLWIQNKINLSLKKLRVNKIYGVLVHDYKDLLGSHGKQFLKSLYYLKKIKKLKKIGLSIERAEDLAKIWSLWKPEIIQVPLNVLDQRILNSGWLDLLKQFKVKVFLRSCFLQGLLLSNYRENFKFNKYYKVLDKFSDWCEQNGTSRLQACLDFIKKYKKKAHYLVIGFNTYLQLKNIIDSFEKKKIVNVPPIFSCNNISLIDPRKW